MERGYLGNPFQINVKTFGGAFACINDLQFGCVHMFM